MLTSGLVMSVLPIEVVRGEHLVNRTGHEVLGKVQGVRPLEDVVAAAQGPVEAVIHQLVGGVTAAIMLRLWLPMASPAPIIDVFVQFQESAQNLVNGLNPYKVQVSDVYRGTENFGYTVFGYSYLPANLYLQTLGYALFGDIRYSYVAAELVAAASLYAASRRRGETLPQRPPGQRRWRGRRGRSECCPRRGRPNRLQRSRGTLRERRQD